MTFTTSKAITERTSYQSILAQLKQPFENAFCYLAAKDMPAVMRTCELFRAIFVHSEVTWRTLGARLPNGQATLTYGQFRNRAVWEHFYRLPQSVPAYYEEDISGVYRNAMLVAVLREGNLRGGRILVKVRPVESEACVELAQFALTHGSPNPSENYITFLGALLETSTLTQAHRNCMVLNISRSIRGIPQTTYEQYEPYGVPHASLLQQVLSKGSIDREMRLEARLIACEHNDMDARVALLERESDPHWASCRHRWMGDIKEPLMNGFGFSSLSDLSSLMQCSRALRVTCINSNSLWLSFGRGMLLPEGHGTFNVNHIRQSTLINRHIISHIQTQGWNAIKDLRYGGYSSVEWYCEKNRQYISPKMFQDAIDKEAFEGHDHSVKLLLKAAGMKLTEGIMLRLAAYGHRGDEVMALLPLCNAHDRGWALRAAINSYGYNHLVSSLTQIALKQKSFFATQEHYDEAFVLAISTMKEEVWTSLLKAQLLTERARGRAIKIVAMGGERKLDKTRIILQTIDSAYEYVEAILQGGSVSEKDRVEAALECFWSHCKHPQASDKKTSMDIAQLILKAPLSRTGTLRAVQGILEWRTGYKQVLTKPEVEDLYIRFFKMLQLKHLTQEERGAAIIKAAEFGCLRVAKFLADSGPYNKEMVFASIKLINGELKAEEIIDALLGSIGVLFSKLRSFVGESKSAS